MLAVIGGFGLAIHTIYFSFVAWSDDPVITTLDTITAPIDEVQFPTVTACADSQPDNWAFLENVLNNVALDCHSQEGCLKTKEVRDDFGYMLERIGTDFEEYLFIDHFNDSRKLVNDMLGLNIRNFDIVARAILEKTEKKEFKVIDLYGLPAKYFGMKGHAIGDFINHLNESERLSNIYNHGYSDSLLPTYCPTSTEACKNVSAMWKLTYTLATSPLKLGTFLNNMVHNHGFVSFDMKNKIKDVEKRFKLGQYSDVCKTMVKKEKDLHEYLITLAKSVGFEESEQVSLYELPALLSQATSIDNWPPVMNQLYLYTLCQKDYNTPDSDNSYYSNSGLTLDKFDLGGSCMVEWNKFFGGKNICFENCLGNSKCLFYIGYATHPCENTDNNFTCCNKWTNTLGNNLEAILKVMRLTYHGKSGFDLKSLIKEPKNQLRYSLVPNIKREVNTHTLLPWCNFEKFGSEKLNHFDIDSCTLFEPVFSDFGLCHSFNPKPVLDLLQPSYFKDAFGNTFADDLLNNQTIYYGTKSGHTMDFYLLGTNHNYNDLEEDGEFFESFASKFLLSVSNKDEYFNMKTMGHKIRAGYHAFWKVHVMETVPSDDIRKIPPEKRNCKFEDETEGLKLFNSYSQSACLFESRVKEAEMKCRCVPWYIPSSAKSKYQICDLFGNFCFNYIYDRARVGKGKCLPSCHQIQFSLDENVEKLPEELCENRQSIESNINLAIYDGSIYVKVQKLREYDKLHENYTFNEEKEIIRKCKNLVKNDLARVTVSFGSKRYVRAKISERASFNDMLGAFGMYK